MENNAPELPDMLKELVTDEDIQAVWGNANFGKRVDPREIIADTLLQYAGGYSTGHTSSMICENLDLLKGYRTTNPRLTPKGKKYMFYAFSRKYNERPAAKVDLEQLKEAVIDLTNLGLGDQKTSTCYASIDMRSKQLLTFLDHLSAAPKKGGENENHG